MAVNKLRIEALIWELLIMIGEDRKREGLVDTPERVANFWAEFIDYDPGKVDVTFASIETDQMVVLKGIRVYSLCEHHLLPMVLDVNIGYITRDKVLGLSKLARIAYKHAHRLQIQERLTRDIADEVRQLANTEDVAVLVEGTHMCMLMRGIRSSGVMVTSVMRGTFKNKPACRAEFLRLIETKGE